MSVFHTENVACPACQSPVQFEVNYSLFADRRPDLRAAIIDGDFQREVCPACGESFRLAPQMTYFDVARQHWILVQPFTELANWKALEKLALDSFAENYGPKSPSAVQMLGRALTVRVVFGWQALREKLIVRDFELDDIPLEVMKAVLLREIDAQPLADDVELRLIDCEDDDLVLAWIKGPQEELLESLRVPQALYDEIVANPVGYAEVASLVSDGPFVDMNRLLVAGERAM